MMPVRALRPLWLALLVLFAALAGLCASRAQDQPPMPVHWTAALQPAPRALQPGQKATVSLTADIDSGWHIYAFPQPPGSSIIPTDVTVPEGQTLSLSGDIQPPEAQSQMDPTVGKAIDIYKDSVTFDLPLKVAKKAHPGKQTLEIDARYQACNDRLCLQPRTEKVDVPVEIASHR
jgi:DsbC/DsbD-like thiol-disulfide interchange protein